MTSERKYEKRGGIYPVLDKSGKQARDKLGRPKWIIQAYAGMYYDEKTRKPEPKVITQRFAGTVKEAKEERLTLMNEAHDTPNLSNRNITLDEFSLSWVESMRVEGKASEETIQRNLKLLEHVAKYIGGMPLRKIRESNINQALAIVASDKTLAGGKGLSGTTLNMVYKQLNRVLELAYQWGLIMRNPCKRVPAPALSSHERMPLSSEECARFMRYLDEREAAEIADFEGKEARMEKLGKQADRLFVKGVSTLSAIVAVRLALNTGARRGEILALDWSCVHFDTVPWIDITKSLSAIKGIKEPKTRSSIGKVSFDDETARHLMTLKRIQDDCMPGFLVERPDEERPVFCNDCGGYFDPNHFSRWWRRFRKDAGLPEGFHFHDLRHTVGTRLENAGVPIVTIQKRLRHAKPSTTFNYYCHKDDAIDEVPANLMASICTERTKKEGEGDKNRPRFYAIA